MRVSFLTLLKILLITATCILVVLLAFGLVLALGWPWWLGFVILFILAGLWIGVLFLRKLLLRRREQQFVQQVIAQDDARLKSTKGKEQDDLREIQDKWKEAVQLLRSSHLKKEGNPLYVLPWYLVMGESGSGKTTAISSARLSSPFAESIRTSGISGTRTCDWWFFEKAIILDTAGRYAIPIDEGRDKEEWQKFLTLLAKYRTKEPINGLIVTVAADKLLGASLEGIEEGGRIIRRRIDELMRTLGAKFPIYVLVTKCDLIQGMTQFCDQLPEKSLDQPMGVINNDLSIKISAFLDSALKTIGDRLRNLRILLLHFYKQKGIDPRILLFPEEFDHLKPGLELFMKGIFEENPYQETPVLRGIYFSSGRQEGSPYSHFLNALGLISEKEILPGTSKGLFLHDLFEKILPKDRRLFAPTKRAIEWRTLTRNLGLISWVLLGVAMCGLLSFSFVKNLSLLRKASAESVKLPELRNEFLADLITMDQSSKAILRIEDQNRNWLIPRFGLRDSIYLEQGLKEKFCKKFQQGFLNPFDKQMATVMASGTGSLSDDMASQYVAHLVRRVNLLKARLEEESLSTLKARPQPPTVFLQTMGNREITPDERKMFGSLYLYYILWRTDSGEINKEIEILQSWLKHVLSLRGNDLQWMVTWANQQGTLMSVTLEHYWGGTQNASNEKPIPPAYTKKGKETIDSFIAEIESALGDPSIIAAGKKAFEKSYRSSAFDAWREFASSFPDGVKRLQTEKEWQHLVEKMPTEHGPFFSFLNTMASELEPLARGQDMTSWLDQLYQFQAIKTLGSQAGFVVKAAEAGKNLFSKLEKTITKEPGEISQSQIAAAGAFRDYMSALSAIVPLEKTRNQAFQATLQIYTEDPAAGTSPFIAASSAAGALKHAMTKGNQDEELIWKLVAGPFDYLWSFARREAACHLQSQWEEKVLSEIRSDGDQQTVQILTKQENPVAKFVKGPLEPFLRYAEPRGYFAKEALGGSLPFEQSFYVFLNKGAQVPKQQRQRYGVTIRGLPTDVNREASLKPHGTRLELLCAGSDPQSLMNLHYPISKTFQWSPETCSAVLFQIEVGNIELTKKYEGTQAFANFIQDFGNGVRTFFPREFPAEKGYLESLRIRYIKVNYQFSGDHEEVRQYVSIPKQIPRSIAQCWEY